MSRVDELIKSPCPQEFSQAIGTVTATANLTWRQLWMLRATCQ
jgi:hypothetical protein